MGPPREGSAEAHSEECYFGGAVVGRVQAVQDFQRFGVSLVFSEIVPCLHVFLAFGSFIGQYLSVRSLAEVDVPVFSMEVPSIANVEEGVECILSFFQAVRVWLVGVGPLGAVVDRE